MSSADLGRYYEVCKEAQYFYLLCLITFSNGLQKINDYREQHPNVFVN